MRLEKPKIIEKPWGREIWLAHEKEYAGKILEIKKGFRTSLQFHRKKKETMYVLEGEVKVLTSDGEILMKSGDSLTINPMERHRTIGVVDSRIIEVSTPELDDVVRLEDDYGR